KGRKIEALEYTIADRDKTIFKFRDLVKSLQNDVKVYETRILAYEAKNDSLKNFTAIETQAKITSDKLFDERIKKTVADTHFKFAKKKYEYLVHFLPPELADLKSDDRINIEAFCLLQLISDKCEIIREKLIELKNLASPISNDHSFVFLIAAKTCYFRFIILKLYSGLTDVSNAKSLNIALNLPQFNIFDTSVSSLLELIANKQIDEKTAVKTFDKLIYQCNNICNANNCNIIHANEIIQATMYGITQLLLDVDCIEALNYQCISDESKQSLKSALISIEKMVDTKRDKDLFLSYSSFSDKIELVVTKLLSDDLVLRKISQSILNAQTFNENCEFCKIIEQITEEVYGKKYSNIETMLRNTIDELTACFSNFDERFATNLTDSKFWLQTLAAPWMCKWSKIDKLHAENTERCNELVQFKQLNSQLKDELSGEKIKVSLLERKLESSTELSNQELNTLRKQVQLTQVEMERYKSEKRSQLLEHQQQLSGVEIENMELKEQLFTCGDRVLVKVSGNQLIPKSKDELTSQLLYLSDRNTFLAKQNSVLRQERVKYMLRNLSDLKTDKPDNFNRWNIRQMEYNKLKVLAFQALSQLDLKGEENIRLKLKMCLNDIARIRIPAAKLLQDTLDDYRQCRILRT
ncbi:hypothetical protein GJ496_003363, partial [Pomphorhynchus laevis]